MEPLTSQRYVSIGHHHPPPPPRPKHHISNNTSPFTTTTNSTHNTVVLFDKLQQPAHPHQPIVHLKPSRQPFRLLDLPTELRKLIYEQYFGPTWEVTLDHERVNVLRSKFHVQGRPSINLLLTSRFIYREAKPVRTRCFNGRLNLNNVFILVPLRKMERFNWLRHNVRILHFNDSSVHPERWNRYYDNFPNLNRLEIEFPSVIRLDERCGEVGEVLSGQRDEVLLQGLDQFRLALVDQLSESVEVVVWQRYCLGRAVVGGWKGVLDVKIQLSRNGTRIVGRVHDDGVSIFDKRQFRRPAEL